MSTNGNSQIYRHSLTSYLHADRTFNCGSVQYFVDTTSSADRSIKLANQYGPYLCTEKSLFYNYLL